jgi:amino acid adenylation domain-containing protein
VTFSANRQRLLDSLIQRKAAASATAMSLPAADRSGPLPASFAQERLWFLDQLEPGCHYNDRVDLRLHGPLNLRLLEASIQAVVARHEVLRTRYAEADGCLQQRIAPPAPWVLPLTDLTDRPAVGREPAGSELAWAESRKPFSLEQGPIWRAHLYRLSPTDHLLALTIHHVAVDGWSKRVLVEELAEHYSRSARRTPPMADLARQYVDYAVWQRSQVTAGAWASHLEFWKQELAGLPTLLTLPYDRPRPKVQSFRGARQAFSLSRETCDRLRLLGNAEQATLFMVLLAGYAALLHRYSDEPDIVVGVPIANRALSEIEPLIGFFVNTIALRMQVDESLTFRQIVRRTRETALRAYSHQALPFERIVEEIQPDRDQSFNPVFQTMLVLQGERPAPLRADDLTLVTLDEHNGTAKFDLTLDLCETHGGLSGWFEYATDLFDAATVGRMAGHLARLLNCAASDPDRPLCSLALLNETERELVLDVWNGREVRREPAAVPYLFELQAKKTPHATAVVCGSTSLTYLELDRRANGLAQRLAGLRVGPNDRVGICLEPGVELPVAVLGVLKAGAAYVPLDPAYPPARLEFIAADAALSIVLTRRYLADRIGSLSAAAAYVDESVDEATRGPDVAYDPERPAYILYTSGSTGQPKGVAMPHRALANLIAWQVEESTCGPRSRTLQYASPSFDVSFQEMFATWASGGILVVTPSDVRRDARALLDYMVVQGVERVFLPFVALQAVADAAECNESLPLTLREIVTAGEALRVTPALAKLMSRLPDCRLQNQYGPTETHVVSSYTLEGPVGGWPTLPPIGRPIANARLYVLDAWHAPVPVGVPGELYVGGVPVATGYLNRPDLTAGRFVRDPFAETPSATMYRTGDRVRWRADGNLEFLGRLDDQVKIRGYRVEVAEIEAVLSTHPAVGDVAVVSREDQVRQRHLVAYIVGHPSSQESPSFRDFLAERLPEYMVPSAFVQLDTLPLTASGKLDRRRLPDPVFTRYDIETAFVAPSFPVEGLIAQMWAELLGMDRVGVNDSFFELGGHSLLATRLMFRIRDVFGVDVPLRRLFESPTVSGLAAAVEDARGRTSAASVPPQVTPDWENLNAPFTLTDVQQAYWIGRTGSLELGGTACHMYTELEVADVDLARLERAIERLIERHPMLRSIVLPDGRQQILPDDLRCQVTVADLRGQPAQIVDTELDKIRERMSWQVLPADRWPLFEIRVSRLDTGCRIHVDFDLLIGDALSIQILVREFLLLYDNPETLLPRLDLSFRDYVLAERALEESDLYRRSKEYWISRLGSIPPAPDLPMVKSPTLVSGAKFTRRSLRLESSEWVVLKRRAAGSGLTASGLLLAAFADVLTTWSGSPRYSINVTLFNRLPVHPQVNHLVGDFTSVTLLAVDSSVPEAFDVRARRLQAQLWSDMDHRHFSGVRVLRELARAQGRPPAAAMPVVFTSTLNIDKVGANTSAVLRRRDVMVHGISQTPQVWLDHQVYEDSDDLVVNWDTIDELFPEGLLDDMFTSYCDWLRRLATNDDVWHEVRRDLTPVNHLAERSEVNATEWPLPDELLHSRFFERAARRPDDVAIVAPGRRFAYGEVRQRAMALSQFLQRRGVPQGALIAVVMEKGWEQIVAVLGILHAGAAYLPIDASLPAARISQLLEIGQASVALTQSWLLESITWPREVDRVAVDSLPAAVEDVPERTVSCAGLAYVIFTSGSTGVPKGVMIDHRGAVNTILDVNHRFGVDDRDRVLALSSLSFDLSVYDIFGTLAAGGAIVLPDVSAARDPAHWTSVMMHEGVTIWNSVPALLEMWLDHVATLGELPRPELRLALLSGDWIPVTLPDRLRAVKRDVEIVSLGGATEASIWSILYPIGRIESSWTSVPYGRPMRNQTFHVLDPTLESRPIWVPGYLYIGGLGVALGYWQDEDKTRSRFLVHPRTGERLYRTGDLGRYLPGGDIEFLGRDDLQVKVQGHRIELSEIETVLLDFPSVRAAVVATLGERHGSKRLVAYVVAEPGGLFAPDQARRFLMDRLPEYMVPTTFVSLDALPLTVNGKIDRNALPPPDAPGVDGTDEFVVPRTATEQAVSEIWRDLLGVQRVGVNDDFFELGGDSLIGTRSILLIRRAFGIELPVRSLFDHPTVAALAGAIEEMIVAETEKPA